MHRKNPIPTWMHASSVCDPQVPLFVPQRDQRARLAAAQRRRYCNSVATAAATAAATLTAWLLRRKCNLLYLEREPCRRRGHQRQSLAVWLNK